MFTYSEKTILDFVLLKVRRVNSVRQTLGMPTTQSNVVFQVGNVCWVLELPYLNQLPLTWTLGSSCVPSHPQICIKISLWWRLYPNCWVSNLEFFRSLPLSVLPTSGCRHQACNLYTRFDSCKQSVLTRDSLTDGLQHWPFMQIVPLLEIGSATFRPR